MSEPNYSPDEVRLLDEFAGRAIGGLVVYPNPNMDMDAAVTIAYGHAAAMLAERRKRVRPPIDERALFRQFVEHQPTPPAEQPADAEVTRLNRALANGTDDLRAADAATTQARRERDEARAELRLIRQTLRITDEQPISAWLRAHEMTSQAWADKCRQAEAELAEAQPVLDAVVQCHSGATPFMHSIAAGKLLDAYADRRRAQQAKQDGGA